MVGSSRAGAAPLAGLFTLVLPMDYRELLQRYVGRVVTIVVLGQNRVTGRVASVGEDCLRLIDTLSVSELEDSQWMARMYDDPDADFGARQPESLVHLSHIMVITCLDDTLPRTIEAPAITENIATSSGFVRPSEPPPIAASGSPASDIVSENRYAAESSWHENRLQMLLGTGLTRLVTTPDAPLLSAIGAARRTFAAQTGLTLPEVRVRDCMTLPADGYRITLDGIEIARGELPVDKLLAIGAEAPLATIDGLETTEPAFGSPAKWVSPGQESRAVLAGCLVIRPETAIATHLQTAIRRHTRRFLTLDLVRSWLAKAHEMSPALIEELAPARLPLARLRDVLAELASEGLRLHPIEPILESVASRIQTANGPDELLADVRVDLGGALIDRLRSSDGSIPLFTLGMDDVDTLTDWIREDEEWNEFASEPAADKDLDQIVENVRRFMALKAPADRPPALAVPRGARRLMRSLLEPVAPNLMVLSYEEIPKETTIHFLGDTGDSTLRAGSRRKPARPAKSLTKGAARPNGAAGAKRSTSGPSPIPPKDRGGNSPR